MSTSRWRDKPVVVRAPASSANLGPGFDALGLALSLHDVAVARVTGGGLDIEVSGEGSGTADAGEAHLVVRAMRAAFDVLGGQPPGLGLRSLNAIPHGRGLGSSAAAVVTGILAARGLATGGAELLPDDAVLALATSLEGHPDNVAACLYGGLTISWVPEPEVPAVAAAGNGSGPVIAPPGPRVVRLPVLAEIRPVVFVAEESLATQTARGALPAAVPHRDAAAQRRARCAAGGGADAGAGGAVRRHPGLSAPAVPGPGHAAHRGPAGPAARSRGGGRGVWRRALRARVHRGGRACWA